MNASKIHVALLVLFALTRGSAAVPQDSAPPLPLAGLTAPDWEQRQNAYEKIKENKGALKRSEIKRALVDLLDRENQVLHKAVADSERNGEVSKKYGEGYLEYYSDLLGVIEKGADWDDPHQLCILAEAAYEPDSPFAARLALDGKAGLAPCLMKKAQGNMFDRHQSIPLLVELSAVANDLTPALQRQIRQAIIAGVHDSEVFVRQPTIEAIGKYGTSEMIPLLKDVAQSDPYSRLMLDGRRRFDVRDAAVNAIQSIKKRTETN